MGQHVRQAPNPCCSMALGPTFQLYLSIPLVVGLTGLVLAWFMRVPSPSPLGSDQAGLVGTPAASQQGFWVA